MTRTKFKFDCPEFYDLHTTCHAHGWKNLAPFSWDDDNKALRFAVGVDGASMDIEVKQNGDVLEASATSHEKLKRSALNDVKAALQRSLGLEMEVSEILKRARKAGPAYVALIEKGAGRLLRAPTLWEDAAKTLFTTNCSWSLTKKMCDSVCSERFSSPTPSGAYPFPPPRKLAELSSEELKKRIPVGYRAGYLSALAKRFVRDPFLEDLETAGFDYGAADKIVRRSNGFADYASAHLLVLAGYFQKVPIDTVVVSYLKRNHRVRKPASFIKRHYGKWGPYRWWGFKLEKMIAGQNWLGD